MFNFLGEGLSLILLSILGAHQLEVTCGCIFKFYAVSGSVCMDILFLKSPWLLTVRLP